MAEAVRQSFVFEAKVNDVAEATNATTAQTEPTVKGETVSTKEPATADKSWMLRAGTPNFTTQMQAYRDNA